eukprot:COSAG01_NODE_9442_length_2446_cov_2.288453_1_plen_508_part_00
MQRIPPQLHRSLSEAAPCPSPRGGTSHTRSRTPPPPLCVHTASRRAVRAATARSHSAVPADKGGADSASRVTLHTRQAGRQPQLDPSRDLGPRHGALRVGGGGRAARDQQWTFRRFRAETAHAVAACCWRWRRRSTFALQLTAAALLTVRRGGGLAAVCEALRVQLHLCTPTAHNHLLLLHGSDMPDVALLRRLAEQRGVPIADVEGAMGSPHPRTALLQLLSATNPDQATYEVMRASNPLALAPPDVEIQEHFMQRAGILGGIEILGGSDDSSSSSGGNAFNCAFDSDDSDDGIQVQSSGDLVQPAQTGEEFEEGEAKVRAAMVEIRSLLERVGPDSAREHWAKWYSLGNKLDLDTRMKDGPDNGVTVELRQLREQIDAAIKLRTRKRAVIVLVTCILTLMWGAHWIYSKTPAYLWSRADCQLSIVKDGRVVRKGGEAHVVHCALGEATLPSGEKVQFPLKDSLRNIIVASNWESMTSGQELRMAAYPGMGPCVFSKDVQLSLCHC